MRDVRWGGMLVFLSVVLGVGSASAQDPDRLYGRVTTTRGEVVEGYLRWDRNEVGWADLLSGSKELPPTHARRGDGWDREERRRSIHILGLRISWTEDDDDRRPRSALSGLRMGHLRSLEPRGRDRALLVLKSGDEVVLEHGSTDLGEELRELVVEAPDRNRSLRWRDLERVEFMAAPAGAGAPAARRLWGTVRTWSGDVFTGFVSWDVDEVLTSDVLDGEEGGRDRKIPFGAIAAIAREGSSGARVTLGNGDEVVLRGTNDVNGSNRGVGVSDPGLGQVLVDWDEFESVTFEEAPLGAAAYDAFGGGQPLYGTVETEAGDQLTGWIRWDDDEEFTWEILDGRHRGVEMDVEFGLVDRVRRRGSWGAEVHLLDGRVFELEDSNDVDEGNKGVFVTFDDGTVEAVRWWDVRQVVFARP